MASRARPGRAGSPPQSCVVLGPLDGVLESVVRLVHKVQEGRRTAHVWVRLTKESPVCRPEFRLGNSLFDPENLVVRANGSQLAPSLVDIDNVNPPRELTGSLRLVARVHSKAAPSPPATKAAVFRTNRRSNRVAASVESDKSDRMNYCDKRQRSSRSTLICDDARGAR